MADEAPEAPSEPVVLKAKAKRASRAKPKEESLPSGSQTTGPKEELEEEPEVEVTASSLDEVQVEVTVQEDAKTDAKADAKVACPDCGKQMSAKTLKYSHVPNCPAKKRTEEKDTLTTPLLRRESVLEEVIENEVQKRLHNKRSERAARREEMVSKLMQNAF